MRHLRQALRRLAKSPGFTAIAVFTLAVGIAANAAIFSVVHAVLLAPLPYAEAERLVDINHSAPGLDLVDIRQSEALHLYYREHAEAFEGFALYNDGAVALTGVDLPEQLRGARVTPSAFELLGVSAARGRVFAEAEGEPGGDAVVILGDGLWRRTFGADPGILGRRIHIDGAAREVIGVMPPAFDFPEAEVELWLPIVLDPNEVDLGSFGTAGLAKLKPGGSVEAANADLARLMAGLPEAFAGERSVDALRKAQLTAQVRPLRDAVVGDIENVLWILLATVGFVLLIACANVANLFLARAEGRQREIAVRTALGATRGELVRGVLAESMTLAALAGVVGLGLSAAAVRLLVRFGPPGLPRLHEVTLGPEVVAFTATVALVAGLLFGIAPALRTRFRELSGVLKDGGRSATAGRGRHRTRRLLVSAQVALALVLLVGAVLMARSYQRLVEVDAGFDSENALAFQISLPSADYPDDASAARFHERLLERLEALPGIEAAAVGSSLPLSGTGAGSGHSLEGRPNDESTLPVVFRVERITPGYVGAMGLRLLQGRDLEPADAEGRKGSVLVSRALAEHYWPGESPLGKRLMPSRNDDRIEDPWYYVVGVVDDVRSETLTESPPETVYYPVLAKVENDWVVGRAGVVVRGDGDLSALVPAMRSAVWDLDPDLPVANPMPVEDMVRRARARPAFTLTLLLVAAGVALLLGSVGTYGVVSYLVAQRTSELGIRVALGARVVDVVGLVMTEGLRILAAGVAVGFVGALVATRWLEAVLFEVDPLDPFTFAAVPFALAAVTLLACFAPAWRAARVDPARSLRSD
ncbi:MAG: ABC transporter permease [Acidobacteriota bacterium]